MKSAENVCVVLARVSSRAQDEEGYSLDAQEHLAEEYCNQNGLKSQKLYRIAETASKTSQRRVFNEMMAFMVKNGINILVVEKVDRLTRSFKDMVMIDDWLEADDRRRVHLIKDGLVMNKFSRSQDKLNWGVKVLFAKNYTDNLREEVYKGRQEKLAQGWLPGRPPFGYKTVGTKGKKIHVPEETEARLIHQLFEAYLDPSHSLTTVTAYAARIGIRTRTGRPMSRSNIVDNVLKNPFYIGINRWQGVDYPGNQEPIISKELFEAVHTKMTRRTPPKYQKHNPELRGIIACSTCSGTITWELQKGIWYGHCSRYRGCPKRRYARQEDIERQLMEHFTGLLCPSKAIIDWVIETLKAKHQNDMYDHTAVITALRQDFDRKKRQLDILYEDRLSERITPERYDELSNRFSDEQKQIQETITNVESKSRNQLLTGIKALEASQKAASIYPTLAPEKKRRLLTELFTEITLDGQTVNVTYNPYTLIVSKKVEKHRKAVQDFRTIKNTPYNGGEAEPSMALRTLWRDIESDFRTTNLVI